MWMLAKRMTGHREKRRRSLGKSVDGDGDTEFVQSIVAGGANLSELTVPSWGVIRTRTKTVPVSSLHTFSSF